MQQAAKTRLWRALVQVLALISQVRLDLIRYAAEQPVCAVLDRRGTKKVALNLWRASRPAVQIQAVPVLAA